MMPVLFPCARALVYPHIFVSETNNLIETNVHAIEKRFREFFFLRKSGYIDM